MSFNNNRPNTGNYYASSAINAGTFNHHLNNPFSQQLERERIISEERLKQRFDEGYVSKYTGPAASVTPTGTYGYNADISRATIPQNLKPAIVEEQELLARRASSSVFNPAGFSGEDQRVSSTKNLNGARSTQELFIAPPTQAAPSMSIKRLVDI